MIGGEKVVPTADLVPDDVPGARWVVIPEGGRLPDGYWRAVYRVQRWVWRMDGGAVRWELDTGLRRIEDGRRLILLVVAPLPSQHWWERYERWLFGEP